MLLYHAARGNGKETSISQFPIFLIYKKSPRGHMHPEPCRMLDVQQLLPKTWIHTPHLVLSSRIQTLNPQDQSATLLLKLSIIEVYNFSTSRCCCRRFSLPIPAAPQSLCCYGELGASTCLNHPQLIQPWVQVCKEGDYPSTSYQPSSSWERKILIGKLK